jgi:hypothetical protein
MAIVRRRLGSNKRVLTLLPTRNFAKKRKIMTTKDEYESEGEVAVTMVVTVDCHDDRNSNNNNMTAMSSSACSTPPTRDFRLETVVTPPPPEVKRVRFALPQSQRQPHAHVIDEDYLQRHKTDLWYPKKHRQQQQLQVQKVIASFKKTHPEIVSNFAAMYKNLAAGDNDETMWPTPSIMVALPLEMRGLEWGITPQLKLRRKRHFRHVLQCAEDRALPESFQQIMRHNVSRNSSRTAVLMARWYATQSEELQVRRKEDEVEIVAPKMTGKKVPGYLAFGKGKAVTGQTRTGLPPRQPLQSKRIRLWQR